MKEKKFKSDAENPMMTQQDHHGAGQFQQQRTKVTVKRCRAHILEFRGVGCHEGPKALISKRTPRQTESEETE